MNWIDVCYWVGTGLQMIATVVVLWRFGGALAAVAGGVCVELLLVALTFGTTGGMYRGAQRWVAGVAIAGMLVVSGGLQLAEVAQHEVALEVASRLQAWQVSAVRVALAVAPTVAVGVVVALKLLGTDSHPNPSPQPSPAGEGAGVVALRREIAEDLAEQFNGRLQELQAQIAARGTVEAVRLPQGEHWQDVNLADVVARMRRDGHEVSATSVRVALIASGVAGVPTRQALAKALGRLV